MGNGVSRSFLKVSPAGEPQEVGIEMTAAALQNLPADSDKVMYMLPLPAVANGATAFNHIVINWNPHGHEPAPYLLPHFDFHFYMMSMDERMNIPSYATNSAGFDNLPDANNLPPNYIPTPEGDAEMGKHWVDKNSPELGGELFTKTFVYGTYNGSVTFFEPMITLAYVKSCSKITAAIPQPSLYASHSYYPTSYNIYKNDTVQTYNVSMSKFVLR